jgi:hypothetical protein
MCLLEQSSQPVKQCSQQAPHFDGTAELLSWATYSPKQFVEEAYLLQ